MIDSSRPSWARRFPEDPVLSLAWTSLFAAIVGLANFALGTTILKEYGFALFCGTPMGMGFLTPFLHGLGGRRSFGSLLGANALSQVILFTTMVTLGLEGLGCLFMCAPLWFLFALLGTVLAYPVHYAMWSGYPEFQRFRGFPVVGLLILLALPLWMGAEKVRPPTPPLVAVTSTVDIDAPSDVVWRHVISFPDLSPPSDWTFKLGAAYPIHAVIDGHGPGAIRRCVFSTGAFIEPITIWDENKLLAFDVTQSPPSMQEVNPFWSDIHPAHLEGYFNSRHGQFKLIDLGNGHTRLEGTTWYENNMFPAAYWQLWSDHIIHQIHLRVLTHIKALSEAEQTSYLESDHAR